MSMTHSPVSCASSTELTDAHHDVVIIGGGLGGLAGAIELARRGFKVAVLDTSHRVSPDYFGYTMWPPATRVLRHLGVYEALAQAGCELEAFRWYDGVGAEWSSLDLAEVAEQGGFIGVLPSRVQMALETRLDELNVHVVRDFSDWQLRPGARGVLHVSFSLSGLTELSTRLVIGCDGSDSTLRGRLGLRAVRWRPPGQLILTGIGRGLAFSESHQSLGAGWSSGCLALGDGGSWLYGIAQGMPTGELVSLVRQRAQRFVAAGDAAAGLTSIAVVRPWSLRVRSWACDGVLLMGDAAHGVLPHLGLGGSLVLEDVPVMADVVENALARADVSAHMLSMFQRRRSACVAYARRISELWAVASTATFPGVRTLRDLSMARVSRRPHLLEALVRELAAGGRPPRLGTRLRALLP